MEVLIEKLSSYHLFNFLLPGVLFVAFVNKYTEHKIKTDQLFMTAFICYFIGLVIGRIGSIVIDPLLKWLSIIKFSSYSDFVLASKNDPTLAMLSEMNNMYRNLFTLGILLFLYKLYDIIEAKFIKQVKWAPYLFVLILLIIFLFSYRKQTDYINKRIVLEKTEDKAK